MAVVHPSVQVPAGLQLVEGEDVGYDQFASVIEDENTTIAGEAVGGFLFSLAHSQQIGGPPVSRTFVRVGDGVGRLAARHTLPALRKLGRSRRERHVRPTALIKPWGNVSAEPPP